jgi:hypothetical protein
MASVILFLTCFFGAIYGPVAEHSMIGSSTDHFPLPTMATIAANPLKLRNVSLKTDSVCDSIYNDTFLGITEFASRKKVSCS